MKTKISIVVIIAFIGCCVRAVHAAPPSNDDFSNAVELVGTFDVKSGTNVETTRQAGERTETGYYTVWYKWTAPSSGRAQFAVLPGGGSPVAYVQLSVWTGTDFPSLVYVGWDGVNFTNEARLSDLPVCAGTQYYIAVGNRHDGPGHVRGSFECSIVLHTNSDLSGRNVVAASGHNTLFSQATALSGTNATAISYGLEAPQREAGEPPVNPNYSSWWKWVAPANGHGRVSLAGTDRGDYYTRWDHRTMVVYQVDDFAAMTVASPVAKSAVPYDLPADLVFPVVANKTYYIAAGQGRWLEGGNYFTGDWDSTPWKVLTVQYSSVSPNHAAIVAKKNALKAKIKKTKKAIKKAKTAKKKKALRKKLANYMRALRRL